MTNLSEFTFLSSDGKTQLHGMLWEPEGVAVRAVLQICHGVAEHIARYDGFARALNEQGIVVAGHDHLGHGKSLPEGGTPVYFGQGSTWNTVVDDIYILHQRLKQRYPDAPLCIMGHSMGSFLTRTYLIRYPGTVKAAVIMGTGWQPPAAITGSPPTRAMWTTTSPTPSAARTPRWACSARCCMAYASTSGRAICGRWTGKYRCCS